MHTNKAEKKNPDQNDKLMFNLKKNCSIFYLNKSSILKTLMLSVNNVLQQKVPDTFDIISLNVYI